MSIHNVVRAGLILVLAYAANGYAAADEIGDAKSKVIAAQSAYQTYSADIEMKLESGDDETSCKSNLVVKADRYLLKASAVVHGYEQGRVKVRDAEGIVWDEQVEDGEKSVTKSNSDVFADFGEFPLGIAMGLLDELMPGPGNLKETLTRYSKYFDYKSAREEKLDGIDVIVFEGPMKKKTREVLEAAVKADAADSNKGPTAETFGLVIRTVAPLTSIRISIAKSDGLPRLIEGTASDGKPAMVQRFTNVVTGAPIDDKVFIYTPAAGVDVVDMILP